MSEVLATTLPAELRQINKCGSIPASHHPGRNNHTSTLPYCFQESHNISIPSKLVETTELSDQKHGVWFFAILMSVVYVFFVVVFRPKYKRVDSERRSSFEQSVYVGTVNR